jgi:aspartyl-tRNA(Asn)/glutamyl-tRNA(Gln) amidotransferase subunit A
MSTRESEFLRWSIKELSKHLRSKKISPVEVVTALLERIEDVDPIINSYITVMSDEALNAAKQAERQIAKGKYKGAMHGIPIGLKDLIYTEGVRTTMGCEIFKDFIPDDDATAVKKLKQAGAIIIGKLNTHQFAFGPTGDRSYFGAVRNPYNLRKVTGGSSSGSGAAVAAGLCFGALGTDTGGSSRIPAACCGVVGMKANFGRVSKYGVFPLSWTLDHVGTLTRTVEDNMILLQSIAGYDSKDPYSLHERFDLDNSTMKSNIRGKIIGVPTSFYFSGITDEIRETVEGALKSFEKMGAKIETVTIPHIEEIATAHFVTIASEAYVVHEERLRSRPEMIDEEVRNRILSGILPTASEYIQAQQLRHLAIREFNQLFEGIDVLVTPTTSAVATDIDQRETVIEGKPQPVRSALNRLTGPTTLLGIPSISVPCGFSKDGLPIGMQLISKAFDETTAYRFAYAFERQSGVNTLKFDIDRANQ